jgi:hypothetical protein
LAVRDAARAFKLIASQNIYQVAIPSGTGHHEIVVQTTDPQVIAPLDAEPQVIILNKMNPLLIISAGPQVVELNATDPPVIAQADPKCVFIIEWSLDT